MLRFSITSTFAALVLGACAPSGGVQLRPHAGWAADVSTTTSINTPADFVVISDSHASYPEAPHELSSNDYITDSVISAAIRPPQMDFWGVRVLAWVLEKAADVDVLHLGDVANISCEYEFDRFAAQMKSFKRRWFYTPGNHDSLLMGNWAYESPAAGAETRWGRECGAERPMDKQLLLHKYIAAKNWKEPGRGDPLDPNYWCVDSESPAPQSEESFDDDYRCVRIDTKVAGVNDPGSAAVVCRKRPLSCSRPAGLEWGDFIVQRVDGPNETVLLLDSTDFRARPGVLRLGGAWGGISDKQLAIAEVLLAEAPSVKPIVIGTHYPVDALDASSQIALQSFIERTHPLVVLTGHTHFATAERFHHFAGSAKKFLEVNVASILSWPMEFSELRVAGTAARPVLSMTVRSVAATLVSTGDCKKDDQTFDERTYDYYTHYRRPRAYAHLLRTMFADEQQHFGGHVLPETLFDRESTTVDVGKALELTGLNPVPSKLVDNVGKYELCQAVFASAADDGDKLEFKEPPTKASGHDNTIFVGDPKSESTQVRMRPPKDPLATRVWTFTSVTSDARSSPGH